MKKSRVIELLKGINNVSSLKGAKFAYGIAKNRQILEKEEEALKSYIKPNDKMLEYNKERDVLVLKFVIKDEKGNPIKYNNEQVSVETEFFEQEKKLKEKYKNELELFEKKKKEYSEMLKEELNINLHLINFKDVSEDITAGQMKGIFELISDKS